MFVCLFVFQVNHIKVVSTDTESLTFAQRLLEQASSTVTLSIKRQVAGNNTLSSSLYPLGGGGVTSTHPLISSPSGHTSYNLNPVIGTHKKETDGVVGGASGSGREKRVRPPNLIPGKKKKVCACVRV